MRTSLVGSLMAVASVVLGRPAAAQENPYATQVDVRMGGRVFQAECGRCHGENAKGNDETGAPDLTAGDFRHASSDARLFEIVRDGIEGTAMVGIGWAHDQTIWQVVAYVRSLRPNPADYDLPGNVENGKTLFSGKGACSSCHMVDGRGGRLGPDLSTIGERRSPEELEQDLNEPDETVEPRWWTMKVTRADGTTLQGLRMNEDTFTLRIMDGEENLWHFSKREVRAIERIETSTMPSAKATLDASEVDDLVAYLFSLRKES